MTDTAKQIADMSVQQQRELLVELLRKKSGKPKQFPLSLAQQGLWFFDRLVPGSSVYNIPVALRLTGPLNLAALQHSLNELTRRHDALRTTFTLGDEGAVQIVAPQGALTISLLDLQELPESKREQQALRLANEEARRPFDLEKGPLARATLLRLRGDQYLFVLVMHHIISEAWSIALLFDELTVLYAAFSKGNLSPLPELPLQFGDFARWQTTRLQGEVLQEQLAYWRQQLAGDLPVLQLPTDRPRPTLQSFRGAWESLELPKDLLESLKVLSRRHGVTLFMTLLASFAALLRRYTGQEDIVIGSPIAGRTRPETEKLIGFFVNTLVLRTDLQGNPSFLELLGRARDVCVSAFSHQDLPFERIVKELQPKRNLSRNPLFQVMFALQNTPMPTLKLPGCTATQPLSPVEIHNGGTKVDLCLIMAETANGLTASFEYSADLFDAATIRRMLGHFRSMLEGIVADPNRTISDLPLLTEAERSQLLVEWNNTRTSYRRDVCVHQLFEAQVERTPEAVAVISEGDQLTYRQLNARANQLANYLRALGVRSDTLVGICAERSLEMVVGILGILKSGGAYVPLDPAAPTERLAFMLEDGRVSVLLTQAPLLTRLPEHGAKRICLDSQWEQIAQESEGNPVGEATADNLAYVIYTSGSTGQPKGVLVTHANVVRLLDATRSWFHFGERDVWTMFHSYAFDFSVWELFGALCYGGRLVVVPYWISRSPEAFYELLCTEGVTVLNQTPSAFRQLVDAEAGRRSAAVSTLRLVIFGGEALDFQSLRPWFDRHGDRAPQLVNMYGITETTVHVTYRPLAIADLSDARGSEIGRPIPDLQVYLLDQHLQPVPIGVAGELHVAGDGVARGYLNRPELTAERFITNPFSDKPSSRLYKSGDLARWLADGNLEYLGRKDQQIKIRGFRVEIGEIESVLGQHPSVREAVVLAREDVPGDQRLVAYVVAKPGEKPTMDAIREFMDRKLPDYMIPATVVWLDAFPLTSSGKLDRRALPAPTHDRPELQRAYVAPRNSTEHKLAAIWADVLGLDRVGIHDNFFELGGHSLSATRIVSQIQKSVSVVLPLHTFFEAPSVAGMCESIKEARQAEQGTSTPLLVPVGRDGELALSYAQERMWFLNQLEPESAAYNVPLAIRLRGPLNVPVLERSLREIVRRHEVLRTTFPSVAGRPVQVIGPEATIRLPVVELTATPTPENDAEIRRLTVEEARCPFDLGQGPLVRATLLRLANADHVLLLTMHHIVSDGWSLSVLNRELAVLYEAYSADQPSPLPALPIQYADFASCTRDWLQGAVLDYQLSYWIRQLDGAPAVLELPTDHPRPAIQSHRGACESLVLPQELSEALQRLSQREGVTLFMTLLAAFKTLLARYTGQYDLVVGSPIAGRNHVETEGLIGFFVNMLAFRTDLSGDPKFLEILGRVRDAALGAYGHQDVPFAKLVEKLQPDRKLSHSPLFQVAFVLQNAPRQALNLRGVTASQLTIDTGTAKFDLTLALIESVDGIRGVLEYNTELFEPETIRRMCVHFQTLLAGIVADPNRPISELPLLTDSERHQLLVKWNDTQTDYVRNSCIHELFEAQVARTPDAVAVVCGDRQLTCRDLNSRANQLAHHLRSLGVGPDVLVGLFMERSTEMVVAILGVLKAGGAYVPLDPSYPAARLAFVLQDTKAPVVITQNGLRDRLSEHDTEVVCLDTDWPTIAQQSVLNQDRRTTPENLVYVIYTSGSTGKPNGVMIPHRGLVNYLCWCTAAYRVADGQGAPVHSPFGFDLTVTSLFAPLLTGKPVLLLPEEAGVESLADVVVERPDFSLVKLTPAHLDLLGQMLSADQIARQRTTFVIGGEALKAETVRPWLPHVPTTRLINEYGPTETVVGCCVYEVPAGATISGSVPIGKPIANTQLYVLDGRLRPVPIGVSGELYIGGDGLARGYLNRPELTAERFIRNPFRDEPSSRLYKTGDLARWLADGNLEFLGRKDQQVKIRGFRIEIGEIEAVLGQHPNVSESAVLAREDVQGDKRLVAYVVLDQATKPTLSELSGFLRQKLPEYMLPAAFVVLDELPLTPNGKLNRRALPPPDRDRRVSEGAYVAPRSTTEHAVAAIWADMLGVERVGVNDNFFELGGHSLLATRVISGIHDTLHVQLPLRTLFEVPTVTGLALAIVQRRAEQTDQARIARILAELEHLSDDDVGSRMGLGANAVIEDGTRNDGSHAELTGRGLGT